MESAMGLTFEKVWATLEKETDRKLFSEALPNRHYNCESLRRRRREKKTMREVLCCRLSFPLRRGNNKQCG
jgi:hypothetical protein